MRLQSIMLIIQATDWYVVRRAPRRGTAAVTGQAYGTHTHTITEEEEGKGKNITSAAGLSFLFLFLNMCANMPPPSAHTPDKETMLV